MFTSWLLARENFKQEWRVGKRQEFLNFRSFVTKSSVLSWGREEKTELHLKAKGCRERKPWQWDSHESPEAITDTHTTHGLMFKKVLNVAFLNNTLLTRCCHFIKFMEVVICKNKNYHKVICCIIIIHKCAKCRQMCWPFKVERLTEIQPDSVL